MTRPRLVAQLLFWGGYGLLMMLGWFAANGRQGQSFLSAFTVTLSVCAALAAASEALRALAQWRGWMERSLLGLALRVTLAVPVLALITQMLIRGVTLTLFALGVIDLPQEVQTLKPHHVVLYALNSSMMLWLWTAGWIAAQALQRWRDGEVTRWRLEAEREKLQRELLLSQLNPHFLFNALNNVRSLILEDADRARDMLSHLSQLLQHSLQQAGHDDVSLAQELAFTQDYLALQALHHEDRLQVRWQLDAPDTARAVPAFCLQLLVENAIKHGIARHPGGGLLQISVQQEGLTLKISVSNPGALKPRPTDARQGLGLANLQERLRQRQPTGTFSLTEGEGRVTATIELPASPPVSVPETQP